MNRLPISYGAFGHLPPAPLIGAFLGRGPATTHILTAPKPPPAISYQRTQVVTIPEGAQPHVVFCRCTQWGHLSEVVPVPPHYIENAHANFGRIPSADRVESSFGRNPVTFSYIGPPTMPSAFSYRRTHLVHLTEELLPRLFTSATPTLPPAVFHQRTQVVTLLEGV